MRYADVRNINDLILSDTALSDCVTEIDPHAVIGSIIDQVYNHLMK